MAAVGEAREAAEVRVQLLGEFRVQAGTDRERGSHLAQPLQLPGGGYGSRSHCDAVDIGDGQRIPARDFDPRAEVMTLVPMRRGPVGLAALNAALERRLNPGERQLVVEGSGLRVGGASRDKPHSRPCRSSRANLK